MNEDDDSDPMIIICQGPPCCELLDEEAIQAQLNGCPWCRRIIVHDDGSETVIEPSRA